MHTFEIDIEDRKYILSCPENAPLGECFDISTRFRRYFFNLIDEHLKNEEENKEVANGTE